MNITKIALKKNGETLVEYAKQSEAGADLITLESAEEARPELSAALNKLGPHLCVALGIGDNYAGGMEVYGLEYDSDTGNFKAQCRKYLVDGQAFEFKTPSLLCKCFSRDFADKLINVFAEARMFVEGERAQQAFDFAKRGAE
jgi:hypothetical protein